MNDKAVKVFEAGDKSSADAIRLFELHYSGYSWMRADVSRDEGLTLYRTASDGAVVSVHFQWCPSGFVGAGPIAAVSILCAAQFGTKNSIRRRVFHEEHCSFEQG